MHCSHFVVIEGMDLYLLKSVPNLHNDRELKFRSKSTIAKRCHAIGFDLFYINLRCHAVGLIQFFFNL